MFRLFNLFRFCILGGQTFEILMMTYNSKIFQKIEFLKTELLKNFNGFEKLFENTFENWRVKIPDFGLERGHFGVKNERKSAKS